MNTFNSDTSAWIRSIAAVMCAAFGCGAFAADHLDTPSVVADPRGDIGDLFAWSAGDGRTLNLAMTLVGHTFSDRIAYEFHIDSGKAFGATSASTTITCRFDVSQAVDCRVGDVRSASGRLRVFAGLRDDPFFNNVKGTRAAYDRAAGALRAGAHLDDAGCPRFDQRASRAILEEWRHTEGGAAKDFLHGWTPASIVVSVDLDLVNRGGAMLAVWATTSTARGQLDRMGRPLTANALLATLGPEEKADALKEQYNAATPATSRAFVTEIGKGLAFYDGLNGQCGDQWLIELGAEPALRYRVLAEVLADDRLWVQSDATSCRQFFAVELARLSADDRFANDCGGRAPTQDAVDVYRSLLVDGALTSITDGVDRDDTVHSTSVFPFLAAPVPAQ
jgi:hypothetical protein